MEIHGSRDMLWQAWSTVSGVVPTRTPREVLKHLKLQISPQGFTLLGTDLEISLRYHIPEITAERFAEILLPAAKVGEILRYAASEDFTLLWEGDMVQLKLGNSQYRLASEDPQHYPPVQTFEETAYYVVPAQSLKKLIKRTSYATDSESAHYALGGVLLETNPESLTLAATDTRRLAVANAVCQVMGQPTSTSSSPIIPTKALTLLERALPDSDQEVYLAPRASDILARCGRVTLSSQLVQGHFPDYRKAIPQQFKIQIDFTVGPLLTAIRQAELVTTSESRGVEFTFEPDNLRLASHSPEFGESQVELPISYTGESLTVTFDPKYIREFLSVLEPAESLQLRMNSASSAAMFETADHYRYVVMPMAR